MITGDNQVFYYDYVFIICGIICTMNNPRNTFSLKSATDPDLKASMTFDTDNIILELNSVDYTLFNQYEVGYCDSNYE
jgi:hypothetical protein